ncbi:MAG: hypothetical protein H6Q86_2928, partial [candidate division NC10 bacterium]|nr:hypothetical protein [candidate division NC10 bacterium]
SPVEETANASRSDPFDQRTDVAFS